MRIECSCVSPSLITSATTGWGMSTTWTAFAICQLPKPITRRPFFKTRSMTKSVPYAPAMASRIFAARATIAFRIS